MRRRSLWSIVGVMLLVGSGAAVEAKEKNHNHLLRGDYAFSGAATCLVSSDRVVNNVLVPGGFNDNLTPFGPPASFPFVISFSIQGVRTFNGDGTGSTVARIVSISHPFALPPSGPNAAFFSRGGASSSDFQTDFTYEVAPDRTFTVQTQLVTGTFDAGTRAGQTVTITNLPPFAGRISKDHRTLTIAHEEAGVQTNTYSNGDVHHELCHRSRILLEQKGGH